MTGVDVRGVLAYTADVVDRGYPTRAQQLRAALVATTELIEAAGHRVAATFEQAQEMDGQGLRPIWCESDPLNPCWDVTRPFSTPLRHWGGGEACPECRLRAALAGVDGVPVESPIGRELK